MANRRMVSLTVVDTDQFMDMPASSQCLYFHLGMRADDDGFVSSPRKITKLVNCSSDDLRILIARGYVLLLGEGLVVITHWKQNNYLRSDRHTPTVYGEELKGLTIINGKYIRSTDSPPASPARSPGSAPPPPPRRRGCDRLRGLCGKCDLKALRGRGRDDDDDGEEGPDERSQKQDRCASHQTGFKNYVKELRREPVRRRTALRLKRTCREDPRKFQGKRGKELNYPVYLL